MPSVCWYVVNSANASPQHHLQSFVIISLPLTNIPDLDSFLAVLHRRQLLKWIPDIIKLLFSLLEKDLLQMLSGNKREHANIIAYMPSVTILQPQICCYILPSGCISQWWHQQLGSVCVSTRACVISLKCPWKSWPVSSTFPYEPLALSCCADITPPFP